MKECSPEDLQRQATENRQNALHTCDLDGGVVQTVMMHALNSSMQQMRDLTARGVLIKLSRGKWDLLESVHARPGRLRL
jgi:hypothetical protein